MLNFDIKAKINEIVEKLKNDDDLLEQFNKNPAKLLEEYIGICKKYDKVAVLELKNKMPEESVRGIADVVRSMGHMEKTVFISFALDNLIALRAYCPDQPAQYLLSSVADVDAMVETLKTHRLSLDVK